MSRFWSDTTLGSNLTDRCSPHLSCPKEGGRKAANISPWLRQFLTQKVPPRIRCSLRKIEISVRVKQREDNDFEVAKKCL